MGLGGPTVPGPVPAGNCTSGRPPGWPYFFLASVGPMIGVQGAGVTVYTESTSCESANPLFASAAVRFPSVVANDPGHRPPAKLAAWDAYP